jgi:Holliday junction DNA helicase RuvA
MALAVLSGMSVHELAQTVTMQDAARLTRVPGIGKKTAERLLLELKGKLGADLGAMAGAASASDHASDILNALLALGYSEKEALAAVKNVMGLWKRAPHAMDKTSHAHSPKEAHLRGAR